MCTFVYNWFFKNMYSIYTGYTSFVLVYIFVQVRWIWPALPHFSHFPTHFALGGIEWPLSSSENEDSCSEAGCGQLSSSVSGLQNSHIYRFCLAWQADRRNNWRKFRAVRAPIIFYPVPKCWARYITDLLEYDVVWVLWREHEVVVCLQVWYKTKVLWVATLCLNYFGYIHMCCTIDHIYPIFQTANKGASVPQFEQP